MRDLLTLCQGQLPERRYAAGDIIMAEGTRVGMILILAEGLVEVMKDGVGFNTISEPGAVFGEMSVLLDAPHTATVKALEPSSFYIVSNPQEFLRSTPEVALSVAELLARRLHAMTTYLVDLKLQFQDHDNHFGMIDEVLDVLSHAQHEDHTPGSDRDPDPNLDD